MRELCGWCKCQAAMGWHTQNLPHAKPIVAACRTQQQLKGHDVHVAIRNSQAIITIYPTSVLAKRVAIGIDIQPNTQAGKTSKGPSLPEKASNSRPIVSCPERLIQYSTNKSRSQDTLSYPSPQPKHPLHIDACPVFPWPHSRASKVLTSACRVPSQIPFSVPVAQHPASASVFRGLRLRTEP